MTMTMKRQHIHICSLTCTFIYLNNPFASMLAISEICLYNISVTSIVTMMNRNRAILSNEIESNQTKTNQIKDILLDSDDNLLYDSDSIPFDLIRFDLISFDRMARFLFIMMTIEVTLIL